MSSFDARRRLYRGEVVVDFVGKREALVRHLRRILLSSRIAGL